MIFRLLGNLKEYNQEINFIGEQDKNDVYINLYYFCIKVKKDEDEFYKLLKKKLKKMIRLSVVQFKQLVSRFDVVEMYDVIVQDLRLLVYLKVIRNTVLVFRYWCFKRKYL